MNEVSSDDNALGTSADVNNNKWLLTKTLLSPLGTSCIFLGKW